MKNSSRCHGVATLPQRAAAALRQVPQFSRSKREQRALCRLAAAIFFSVHLTFGEHLLYTINKANRVCGFIKRSTKDFSSTDAIRTLYVALVRSIICYWSVIWRSPLRKDEKLLESVQHSMLRHLTWVNGEPLHRFCHDYNHLGLQYELPTIKSLFDYNDAIFLYKVFSNSIRCPEIRNRFKMNSKPRALRHYNLFYTALPTSRLITRNPIFRLSKLGNWLTYEKPVLRNFDLEIGVSKNIIKNLILSFE